MSFKRKNTKPIRVSEVQRQNEQPEMSCYEMPRAPCEVMTHTPAEESSEYAAASRSWQSVISFPSNSLSLPTMVNPSSSTNYRWSSHSLTTNGFPMISNGEHSDSFLSGAPSALPPPKKSRKIRFKYPEGSQGDVKYRCEVCQYCTNRSDHYKRHLITHSADKPLKCATCGYGTGRSDHFRRHLSRHGFTLEEIDKQCEMNGIKSAHSRSNNRNVSEQLAETDDVLAFQEKCSTTDHNSTTITGVQSAATKRYSCVLCDYATDRISHYTRHVKIHSDERPYQCEACGKEFKLVSYLKKHRCPLKRKSPSPEGPLPDPLDSLIVANAPLSSITTTMPVNLVPGSEFPDICSTCGVTFTTLADIATHICSDMLGSL